MLATYNPQEKINNKEHYDNDNRKINEAEGEGTDHSRTGGGQSSPSHIEESALRPNLHGDASKGGQFTDQLIQYRSHMFASKNRTRGKHAAIMENSVSININEHSRLSKHDRSVNSKSPPGSRSKMRSGQKLRKHFPSDSFETEKAPEDSDQALIRMNKEIPSELEMVEIVKNQKRRRLTMLESQGVTNFNNFFLHNQDIKGQGPADKVLAELSSADNIAGDQEGDTILGIMVNSYNAVKEMMDINEMVSKSHLKLAPVPKLLPKSVNLAEFIGLQKALEEFCVKFKALYIKSYVPHLPILSISSKLLSNFRGFIITVHKLRAKFTSSVYSDKLGDSSSVQRARSGQECYGSVDICLFVSIRSGTDILQHSYPQSDVPDLH